MKAFPYKALGDLTKKLAKIAGELDPVIAFRFRVEGAYEIDREGGMNLGVGAKTLAALGSLPVEVALDTNAVRAFAGEGDGSFFIEITKPSTP